MQKAFPQAGFEVIGEYRDRTIRRQARFSSNAFLAIGLSLVCILLYVAFRFEIGYGIGAVVATVHDVLMTIGVFVLFGSPVQCPDGGGDSAHRRLLDQ